MQPAKFFETSALQAFTIATISACANNAGKISSPSDPFAITRPLQTINESTEVLPFVLPAQLGEDIAAYTSHQRFAPLI